MHGNTVNICVNWGRDVELGRIEKKMREHVVMIVRIEVVISNVYDSVQKNIYKIFMVSTILFVTEMVKIFMDG